MKSGLRPFLALDEADCWIRPGRVPAFLHVLRRLSERIGMQTLVVSHHDVASLGGAIALVARRVEVDTCCDFQAEFFDKPRQRVPHTPHAP